MTTDRHILEAKYRSVTGILPKVEYYFAFIRWCIKERPDLTAGHDYNKMYIILEDIENSETYEYADESDIEIVFKYLREIYNP